jgi:putative Mn2+ efflux pump MntP
MNTGYRRQQYRQAQSESLDPGWMLIFAITAIILALAGLPWIILGFVMQRYLSRWLHWRLSFLLWTALLFIGAFVLYNSYQHGLQAVLNRELTDYVSAAKHYQLDLLRWPLGQLWSETWPIWLRTVWGIGIAGFVAELYANRSDTCTGYFDHPFSK